MRHYGIATRPSAAALALPVWQASRAAFRSSAGPPTVRRPLRHTAICPLHSALTGSPLRAPRLQGRHPVNGRCSARGAPRHAPGWLRLTAEVQDAMHARVSAPVQDGRLAARRPERPAVAGRGGGREEAAPALPWEETAALGALAGEAALLDQAAAAAHAAAPLDDLPATGSWVAGSDAWGQPRKQLKPAALVHRPLAALGVLSPAGMPGSSSQYRDKTPRHPLRNCRQNQSVSAGVWGRTMRLPNSQEPMAKGMTPASAPA